MRQGSPAAGIEGFAGRATELAMLATCLEAGGPRVIHLSGVAGIGKSTLLSVFCAQAEARGVRTVRLDCSAVEPSVPGLLGALAGTIGARSPTLGPLVRAWKADSATTVLVLDTYELFWLMDTFIRRELCPTLPESVRVVLAGRNGPVGAWLTSPEWRRRFRTITLGPLTTREAVECLAAVGLDEATSRRVNRIARGHPLALSVAASLGDNALGAVEDAATTAVVDHLTHRFLAEVRDEETRLALEAASVVRRVTDSILGAMLPGISAAESLRRLETLPFTETRRDGLFVHDAVRDAIATRLAAVRPERYRALRVAAWRQLREEVKGATRANLWRYTADILYLLQKPEIREGFFPSGYQPLAVEEALAEDAGAITEIVASHEGPDARAALAAWWEHQPGAFRVCRDGQGSTSGVFVVANGAELAEAVIVADPVAAAWREDMLRYGPPERSLLLRRLLDREEGEAASGSRGAFGLDVKRTYMEMRPNLRYVYLAGTEPANFDWCDSLGFRRASELDRILDGLTYATYRLDMGPGSVDTWLAGLVADELGIGPRKLRDLSFDSEAREVTMPSGTVALTALESALLAVLWDHADRPVARVDLIDHVWGYGNGASSNVVDAVVLTLRRKLGPHATAIETVRGVGYRLRAE